MPDVDEPPHPLDREASETVFGLLAAIGVGRPRGPLGVRVAVACGAGVIVGVQLAVVGMVAVAGNEPMLVPSLGPTVFLLVFAPTLKVARPRSTVGGHLVGLLAGVGGRMVFGLYGTGPALAGPFGLAEVAAAVVAVTLTALLTALLDVTHPPSAATALVVGLGLIEQPSGLAALVGGVLLVVALGGLTARAAGLPLGSRAQ